MQPEGPDQASHAVEAALEQEAELRALWAETCDLGSEDASMTLSRLPTQKAVPTLAMAQPAPARLVQAPLKHAAATVDLAAATIHRLAEVGHETLGTDLPTEHLPEAAPAHTNPPPDAPAPGGAPEVGFAETLFATDPAAHPVGAATEAATDPAGVGFAETLMADDDALAVVTGETLVADVRSTQDHGAVATVRTPGGESGGQGGGVFELIERIGEGGMGVVWRARQGSLDREVAIKAIRPEVASPEARERFIAEAVVTGGLDHPNVIPVHELGVGAGGDVFLAMKLVGGHAWSALLHPRTDAEREAATEFDLRRHLDILGQVANAVAFAHSRGVVHRDLKPENVMVGAYGEVVLMDWGIAVDVRMPRPADVRGVHKLDVRGPAGTPAYMAPELARGNGKAIGPQTDVYLLGAILHEIATRHPPHQGRNLGEVLLAAARSDPPEWPHEAPRALQAICHRAMSRDPADRYPDAEAFQAALRDYLEHESSLRLSQEANVLLKRLQTPGAVARAERYGLYARVQARFAQAVELWDGNRDAHEGAAQVARLLAEEALDRGDTGLADAQREAIAPLVAAGDTRALAVAAAIERSRSRGRGARWLTVLAVLAVVGVLWAVRDLGRRNARERAVAAAQERRAAALRDGWQAIADGQLARARTLVERLRARPGDAPDPRAHALETARAVALWQRGAWAELFGALCPDIGRPAGTRTLRYQIRAAIEVQGTALAAALDDRGARAGADRGPLCDVVLDAVMAGAPANAGLVATALLEAAAQPEPYDSDLRRALRRGAICALAHDSRGCSTSELPFEVRVPGAAVPMPVLTRTTSGAWQAIDPDTGVSLWHGPPPPKKQGSAIALPLSDGSLLLAEGPYLLRRDVASGRLLARIPLPGLALQAWPVPPERASVAVALWAGRDRGSVVRIELDPEFPNRPEWTADDAADVVGARPALVAMVDEIFDDVARELAISVPRARLDGRAWALATVRLWEELWRDRADPEVVLAALDGMGAAAATDPAAATLAEAVAFATSMWPPLGQVDVAARLDRFGLAAQADAIIDRAAEAALTAGHNADLERDAGRTPAAVLRRAALAAERRGDAARALALIERSFRFSSGMDDDAELLARVRVHLAAAGLAMPPALAAHAERVLREGAALRSHDDVRRLDMALVLLSLLALLLGTALLRLWWRSAPARREDLRAAGFRDWRAATMAFLSHPGDRIRLSFLAYSTRPERLSLGVFGIVVFLVVGALIGELARLHRVEHASAPLVAGSLRHPDRVTLLQAVAREDARAAFARHRLLAETEVAAGRNAGARAALEHAIALRPDDAASAQNLAVLDELRGQRQPAKARYDALAGVQPAAAWNRARLRGEARGPGTAVFEALPWRDRLYAEVAPDAALWARPAADDLRQLLHGGATEGVLLLLRAAQGELGPIAALFSKWSATARVVTLLGLLFDSLLAAGLGLCALAALPMPVRRWGQRPVARWQQTFGAVLRWLAPGWRLAGAGRAATGVGLAVASAVGAAAAVAAWGLGPMRYVAGGAVGDALFATAEASSLRAVSTAMQAAMAVGALAFTLHLLLEWRASRAISRES